MVATISYIHISVVRDTPSPYQLLQVSVLAPELQTGLWKRCPHFQQFLFHLCQYSLLCLSEQVLLQESLYLGFRSQQLLLAQLAAFSLATISCLFSRACITRACLLSFTRSTSWSHRRCICHSTGSTPSGALGYLAAICSIGMLLSYS